ncbi:hypothetical protein J9253_01390 [Thiothrix litoralis]|uniref:Ig-like domain (Group 3) n=1 Tax=Thiothrix litoralis TaxID=2891210 RepID=A0ABX7WSS1_9GAMM|nr:hypothetical protein [Thiothrix litoralis]QTR46640.1 hypothetical protein J9253_01390 [Thiothrix litoralis]
MVSQQTGTGFVALSSRFPWWRLALLPLAASLLTACGDATNIANSDDGLSSDLATIASTRPVVENTSQTSSETVTIPTRVNTAPAASSSTDYRSSGHTELDQRDTPQTSSGTVTIPTRANTTPVASNVTISDSNGGSAMVGDLLNGTYTYTDAKNDPQGISTFRWLRNGSVIAGATSQSYMIVAADAGTTITFEVIPVAASRQAGITTGASVTSSGINVVATSSPVNVTISGKATFDLVPVKLTGLDYNNTVISNVRKATVEALDASNTVIASTKTGIDGTYSVTVPANTPVKIRVKAELADYSLMVVDNTNSQALYSLDGSLTTSGMSNSTRDLYAPSGWGGNGYTSGAARKSAPFAILNSMYTVCEKIRAVDPAATFSPLKVNWSVNNVPTVGDKALGQIDTSHYDSDVVGLYILGKENVDTDEFDDHIMIHEWGHYFEDKFSRSDSMGGIHSDGDILDMRLAFGEAWGNALSGMITDDPLYVDTSGMNQASIGLELNVETQEAVEPGFYSEGSLQRVLYDLYDSTNETGDAVSLGFGSIYSTMIGKEKNTQAYTSIFTFIKAIKENNPSQAANIDSVVAMENMEPINDIYGSAQTDNRSGNLNVLPIYTPLTVGGGAVERCSVVDLSAPNPGNRLSVRRYFRFTIAAAGDYTITAERTSGRDPAKIVFNVAKASPFNATFIEAQDTAPNTQTVTQNLVAGDYVMEVYDVDNAEGAGANVCFNVSIN